MTLHRPLFFSIAQILLPLLLPSQGQSWKLPLPSSPRSTISHPSVIRCYNPGPFQATSQGAVQPRREAHMKPLTAIPILQARKEAQRHVWLIWGTSYHWEDPRPACSRLLLGRNCLSVADAATWWLVWKGASCPYSVSCVFPSLLKLGAPRIWEQAGKKGSQQCQSTPWYVARLYLPGIQCCLPALRALSLLSWEILNKKRPRP